MDSPSRACGGLRGLREGPLSPCQGTHVLGELSLHEGTQRGVCWLGLIHGA